MNNTIKSLDDIISTCCRKNSNLIIVDSKKEGDKTFVWYRCKECDNICLKRG